MKLTTLKHANIIQLLGIESLPIEKRGEIVEKAVELVDARVLGRALEQLNSKDQETFANILEEGTTKEAYDFLSLHKVELVKLSEEEIEKVKHELLALAEERE